MKLWKPRLQRHRVAVLKHIGKQLKGSSIDLHYSMTMTTQLPRPITCFCSWNWI